MGRVESQGETSQGFAANPLWTDRFDEMFHVQVVAAVRQHMAEALLLQMR